MVENAEIIYDLNIKKVFLIKLKDKKTIIFKNYKIIVVAYILRLGLLQMKESKFLVIYSAHVTN